MMCAKVQKVGSVLLMGIITGLIYYVTGQFTLVILVTFVLACGLAELTRGLTHYQMCIRDRVYTFVGYREGEEPVSEQEQEFLYELVSTMTEAPEEDEA